jgi:hypothetical protein
MSTAHESDPTPARLRLRGHVIVAAVVGIVVVAAGWVSALHLDALGRRHDGGTAGRVSAASSASVPRRPRLRRPRRDGRHHHTFDSRPAWLASAPPRRPPQARAVDVERRYPVSTYDTYVDRPATSPNGASRRRPARSTHLLVPAERRRGPTRALAIPGALRAWVRPDRRLLRAAGAPGRQATWCGPTYPILSGIQRSQPCRLRKLFGGAFVISRPSLPRARRSQARRRAHIAAAGHSDGEMVSLPSGCGVRCRGSVGDHDGGRPVAPGRPFVTPACRSCTSWRRTTVTRTRIQWDRDNLTAPVDAPLVNGAMPLTNRRPTSSW